MMEDNKYKPYSAYTLDQHLTIIIYNVHRKSMVHKYGEICTIDINVKIYIVFTSLLCEHNSEKTHIKCISVHMNT